MFRVIVQCNIFYKLQKNMRLICKATYNFLLEKNSYLVVPFEDECNIYESQIILKNAVTVSIVK